MTKNTAYLFAAVAAFGFVGVQLLAAQDAPPAAPTNVAQQVISKQLGDLLIANAQCSAQVQALNDQLAKLTKDKAGDAPSGTTPGPAMTPPPTKKP